MAEKLLTDAKIRDAKPKAKERLLADGNGLYLRIRGTGKDWLYIYSLDGRRRKQGLGSYPEVTLARAREKVAVSRSAVADGRDAIKAAEDSRIAQKAAEAATAARLTVAQLYTLWFETQIAPRHKDGGISVDAICQKDVLPAIGHRIADEIKRTDVMAIIDNARKRGIKVTLNKLLQLMRQMFWFALVREIVKVDPTAGIEKKDAGGKAGERTRTLAEDEIRLLAGLLPNSGVVPSTRAAFWIMLSTCCRLGELINATWDEIDLEAATWTIPAAHAKNAREHLVFLSPFALSQFHALKAGRTSQTWLYPNPQFDGPMWPNSIQRQFRDRQLRPDLTKLRNSVPRSLLLQGGMWTCHDLRRTGATLMGELGVRSDVIERILNHIEPKKLIRTYQRQELLEERKAAYAMLGARLELITSRNSRVVPANFRRTREFG